MDALDSFEEMTILIDSFGSVQVQNAQLARKKFLN